MGFILLSMAVGLSAGAVSAYSTKYFVGLLISALSLAGFIGKYYLSLINMAAMAQDITLLEMLGVLRDAMPTSVVQALMLFPAFFFAARFLAWFYKENIAVDPLAHETREQRKYRLRGEYGVSADGTTVMKTAAR